jgi:hypothetical protein
MISLATRLVTLRLSLLAYAELVKEANHAGEPVGTHLRRILEAHFVGTKRLREKVQIATRN